MVSFNLRSIGVYVVLRFPSRVEISDGCRVCDGWGRWMWGVRIGVGRAAVEVLGVLFMEVYVSVFKLGAVGLEESVPELVESGVV